MTYLRNLMFRNFYNIFPSYFPAKEASLDCICSVQLYVSVKVLFSKNLVMARCIKWNPSIVGLKDLLLICSLKVQLIRKWQTWSNILTCYNNSFQGCHKLELWTNFSGEQTLFRLSVKFQFCFQSGDYLWPCIFRIWLHRHGHSFVKVK